MKVQMSINDNLLERIDKAAKENYLSRSTFVSIAVSQYLNSAEMVSALRDLSMCMRKIADTGTVDDETKQKIADLERFVSMVSASSVK